MTVFNLLAIPFTLTGLFKLLKAPTPKAKAVILKQSSFNLASPRTAAPAINRLLTDRLQTDVFIASKMIARAKRAKDAVAKRKEEAHDSKKDKWLKGYSGEGAPESCAWFDITQLALHVGCQIEN